MLTRFQWSLQVGLNSEARLQLLPPSVAAIQRTHHAHTLTRAERVRAHGPPCVYGVFMVIFTPPLIMFYHRAHRTTEYGLPQMMTVHCSSNWSGAHTVRVFLILRFVQFASHNLTHNNITPSTFIATKRYCSRQSPAFSLSGFIEFDTLLSYLKINNQFSFAF